MTDRPPTLQEEIDVVNRVVARILAAGIYATTALYAFGVALMFIHHDHALAQQAHYYRSLPEFTAALLRLDAEPFMLMGTVALILTPVTRVFISIFTFARERDRLYVLITAFVFAVIVLSIVVGSVFNIRVG